MNNQELINILKSIGWTPKKNVDQSAEKRLGDRSAFLVFQLKELSSYQSFEATLCIKSPKFTDAIRSIEGRSNFNDFLFVNFGEVARIIGENISKDQIIAICEDTVTWAKSFDIDKRYKELCDLAPSTPGAAGVWHLAALALSGNIEKLEEYQKCLSTGNNPGFVKYITSEYIDRALEFALRPKYNKDTLLKS